MTPDRPDGRVQFSLPTSFVEVLLRMHEAFGPGVLEALRAGHVASQPTRTDAEALASAAPSVPPPGRYAAEFLGVTVTATTLPKLYEQVIDLTDHVAPEALDVLAEVRMRTRRYISRNRNLVHSDNGRLPVHQTKSGWWISKNIGHRDLERALRALASTCGLIYGVDVIFPTVRAEYRLDSNPSGG